MGLTGQMQRTRQRTPSLLTGGAVERRAAMAWMGVWLVGAAAFTVACSGASVAGDDTGLQPLVGDWRGVLLSAGGELPFKIRINREGSGVPGVVINGEHEVPFAEVSRQGAASYTLRFVTPTQSEIVARMSPSEEVLSGYWRYEYAAGEGNDEEGRGGVTQMPFSATKNDLRRFQRNDPELEVASPEGSAAVPDVSGMWAADPPWDSGAGTRPAFAQEAERVVVSPAGESPPMEGIYRSGLLRLSAFDGAVAMLLHARAMPDGALRGQVWVADGDGFAWEARR